MKIANTLIIFQLQALEDNYIYVIHDEASGETVAIDPSEAAPVLKLLTEKNWTLTKILNTHHHWDHVGGNLELKKATGCMIIGSYYDKDRIPGLDETVIEGDLIHIGKHTAKIIEIPGHTLGHIAFWFRDAKTLFCADTLFSLGCGRLFEGTPEQMWQSLHKLRSLPDDTMVYCAHEYTEANARFALTIEHENVTLLKRAHDVKALRATGQPTVPSLLGEEKAANPFLRADAPEIQKAVHQIGDTIGTFAKLRKMKDDF
ncbi:MAG: hydroxyacylglutathione hydrolase [Alphaproteobacteria bacterium]|jgi:hydroxyacylglutathione hydrolase|nr:hydroxyacylglutathione hydrolase [Alphaproteobacteria bacterium]MBT5390441.1 hydroxyacylglutathione hydrolase [Alphaproteobacteria bacterium]MBT5540238.1 hydroxyacylglutathione hydrolase [Alphaproteobacteria bacterium]MBT5654142.1 hydroxyacylglutathione hydrolase [Alphaproteobacteria bacterium]